MNISLFEWKIQNPKTLDNKFHALCSYMAMFPPWLPRYFIKKYSREGDKILDPFSGRGTTVLESCILNRIGIGNDRNPLAYLLTRAKSNIPSKKRLTFRINELQKEFDELKESINPELEHENIKMLFSDYTLKQLIFLKNKLEWKKKNIDTFIAAMITGIIHGSSENYLSISMPNTFSMSPNYIKGYIETHNLQRSDRDVFDILKIKLDRYYIITPESKGRTYNLDVRNIYPIKDSSIDLVITSPPYTKVIRYGQFNWIRLWFLGKKAKDIDGKLFFTQSLDKYCGFMFDTLKELKRVLKPNKKLILVIGDIREKNLADEVWKRCAEPLGFKLVENIEDKIKDNDKVSKIWGEKRGNVTKIDRILVLEK